VDTDPPASRSSRGDSARSWPDHPTRPRNVEMSVQHEAAVMRPNPREQPDDSS